MSRTNSEHDRLQCLFEGFGEAALDDPEMTREILADAGLDPDRLAEEGAALAHQLYGAVRLRSAAERRAGMERAVIKYRERIVERLQATGGDVRAELARLLTGSDTARLQAYFRKIEDLGEEDALDMLTDAELLQLLNELDKTSSHEGESDSDE